MSRHLDLHNHTASLVSEKLCACFYLHIHAFVASWVITTAKIDLYMPAVPSSILVVLPKCIASATRQELNMDMESMSNRIYRHS